MAVARGIMVFLVFWVVIWGALTLFLRLSKRARWTLARSLSVAAMAAVVAMALLSVFVVLF